MKRSFLFTALLALFSYGIIFATNIDILKDPPPPPLPSISEYTIPLSANFNAMDLKLDFDNSVGMVTITVYNSSNQVIYQEIVNTDETPEVYIPAVSWVTGNYTLTITYFTTTLKGEFQIE